MILELMQHMTSMDFPNRFIVVLFAILAKFPDWMAPWKAGVKREGAEYTPAFNRDRPSQKDFTYRT